MKKLIPVLVLVMVAGMAFGQTFQKGSVLGMYHFEIVLKPNVTFEMYLNFLKNKHLPELEKQFPGTTGIILKADRGEYKNEYTLLWHFNSVEERDKYIDAGGDWTEVGQSASDNLSTWEGLNGLGTWSSTVTDWVIL
jgi:hypothetical protein